MKSLNVFYEDHLVGKLTRDDDLVYAFAYSESWRNNSVAFPLSIAMPLDVESFGNRITLSFFENLLPEGEVKENLARAHGISGTFDFLKNYGKDCAGAIIVTDQEHNAPSQRTQAVVPINMQNVYAAIDERHSVADVIARLNPGYLSLAGAQDKFPAIFDGKNFSLPLNGGPTTHIVKAPIQHSGIKESVFNEYYCMELARAVGLKVPKCQITEGRHPLFVIERYDRYKDKQGIIHRIHQQDFCQAQGFTSEFKYESKGGPTLKANYDLVQAHVHPHKILDSTKLFLDWISFNLLIGNNDSHSKNISFLLRDNKKELSPFYDLICTTIYPNLTKAFSFKIGDRDDFSKISKNQIALMEKSLNLKTGVFREHLATLAQKISEQKKPLAKLLAKQFPEAKIPERISDLIEDRIKSLKLQMAI